MISKNFTAGFVTTRIFEVDARKFPDCFQSKSVMISNKSKKSRAYILNVQSPPTSNSTDDIAASSVPGTSTSQINIPSKIIEKTHIKMPQQNQLQKHQVES